MKKDQLVKSFLTHFKKGKTYNSQEIKTFLNKIGSKFNSQNPVTFSYNQWNTGMQDILPLFIYQGRAAHLFIGPDANYVGYAFHRPKDNRKAFNKIGSWDGDNSFTFIDKNIKSFAEWKRDLKKY